MIKGIFQWVGNIYWELVGWVRYLYHYRLPAVFIFPFRNGWLSTLYVLVLLALLVPYLPYIPGDSILLYQWSKQIGEEGAQWIIDLIEAVALPLLMGWSVWGLIAGLWARPRAKFFDVLREAGIGVLRGPGARMPFLKRLADEGASGIGLGPTNMLLPEYVARDEDARLRDTLRALCRKRDMYGVVIAGQAVAGKTRTAMELIHDARPPIVLVWPRTIDATKGLAPFPAWRGKAIVLADNLTLSPAGGDVPLPAGLMQLLQRCRRTVLVGTIRTHLLTEDLRRLDVIELSKTPRGDARVRAFAEVVARAESVPVASVLKRFNGHMAGLVVGLGAMRKLYRELDADSRAFLQAARLLWGLGLRSLTLDRLWKATGMIVGEEMAPGARGDILDELSRLGFVSVHTNGMERVEIYEAYLDEVVSGLHGEQELGERILEQWQVDKDGEAFFERGMVMNIRGRKDEAEAAWRQAIQADPNVAAAHSNLGVLLVELGRKDEAEAAYRQAIQADPNYAVAHSNLGLLLVDQGRKGEAEAAYRQAIQADPNDAVAHSNLGNLLKEQGCKDEAEAAYRQAIQADPNVAAAHNNLGLLLVDQGRKGEAEAAYRQAIQADSSVAAAHHNLGNLLKEQGCKDEAEAAYRQAIQADPNVAAAHYNLGLLLAEQGRRDEAEAAYRQAIQADPNDAAAHSNLGVLLDDLGRKDEAEAAWRQAIQADPNYAAAHYNLGNLLKEQGRKDEAEAAYRQAIQADPNLAQAHYNLGVLLVEQGRKDEAEAAWRQAIQADPNLAQAHYNLGVLLYEQGRKDEAEAAYRQAIQADPSLAQALANLAGESHESGLRSDNGNQ